MDSPRKVAIQTVYGCLKDAKTLSENWSDISDGQFYFSQISERASYIKWSSNELIKYLAEHQDTPPLIVIEQFRDKMYDYSHLNPKGSFIFSVAYEVALYVITKLVD